MVLLSHRSFFVQHNLEKINRKFRCGLGHDDIYKVANSGLGRYKRACGDVVNFILAPKVLETENKRDKRPELINPLEYYIVQHSRFV